MMHPELTNIQSRYERILDDNDAGHINVDQAMGMIAQLTTVDGDGWVWSMDPTTGSFLRAQPGGASQQADPGMFAPAQLGGDRGSRGPDLMRPPTVSGGGSNGTTPLPHGFGQADQRAYPGSGQWDDSQGVPGNPMGDGVYGQPGMPGQPGMESYGEPGPMPGFADVSGSRPLPDESDRPRKTPRIKMPRTRAPRPDGQSVTANVAGLAGRAEEMLRGRWRTILVVGAIVIAVVAVTHKSAPATSSGIPTGPVTTNPAPGGTTVPAPSTTAVAVPKVPSVAAMNTVLATLGSGNAGRASGVMVSPGSGPALARDVALWAGMAKTGLLVTTSPAASTGASAVSTVTVSEHSSGVPVYRGAATWTQSGGVWMLAGWPGLTPTP